MVLTKEDRIALLAKAREAKAKKRVSVKEEETEDVEEETPVVNVPMPEPEPPTPKKKTGRKPKEVVPLPVPVEVVQIEEEPLPPKKKALPIKWLKNPKTEVEKVCCDKKLTKEEPLIEDKPQVVAETIVVPPQKEIKKVRKVRASTPTRTLELTPPRDIVDVIEELKEDNTKYLPKVRQAQPPSAPISIKHQDIPLRLFDY
jgi:hypothetical protein